MNLAALTMWWAVGGVLELTDQGKWNLTLSVLGPLLYTVTKRWVKWHKSIEKIVQFWKAVAIPNSYTRNYQFCLSFLSVKEEITSNWEKWVSNPLLPLTHCDLEWVSDAPDLSILIRNESLRLDDITNQQQKNPCVLKPDARDSCTPQPQSFVR